MNLNDVISEAPDKNLVPMGGGQNVSPEMGDALDDRPIGSDASKQDKSPEGEITSKNRVALAQILDGDQQAVTEVIRAMSFLKEKRGVPANFAESLNKLIMNSIGIQIQLGVTQTRRGQDLAKQQAKTAGLESIQEEITGQDRVAIKQIVPDNEKVNDIIRAMQRIQQGKNPPTDTIPALNDLIQNSIGIQIQLGTAQTKRGQDMVKQQQRAGGLDKQKQFPGVVDRILSKQQADNVPQGKPSKQQMANFIKNESLGYAMPSEDEESERVSYSKTKKQGDASVTVSANADSMDELHDILRLAGIDFEKSGEVDHTPDHKDHDDHEEPEMEPKDDMDQVMVISPADASMSTDKEVLTNYLKDKLKKSLS
tara:strand:- start:31963 stop:33066 length:1104 start_codon:yes stop_codon:yes gene_type:complete